MFRILVVDDDPSAAQLLREVMKNLQHRPELDFVKDGVEALDFLHRRGAYIEAPSADLILLDVNLPRLSGLETLSAIKNDPELCVIPVIMLSSANSPADVRRSYQAHANCYVQKPIDLDRSVKLVQAMEAFWMDFVLLPPSNPPRPGSPQSTDSKGIHPAWDASKRGESHSGPPIASRSAEEARSRAMRMFDSPARETATPSRGWGCEEHNNLLDGFGEAVHELLKLHEQQFLAIVDGDGESHRFDLLIHMANEKKQLAKYAYIRHVESHGCSSMNALNETRT